MNTAALALFLEPDRFQFHAEAAEGGVFSDDARTLTRVVDGACIFHNRPGFAGGEGCALHLGALDAGESPTTWKPSVCWQLPLRADPQPDGSRTLRRWARTDWDDETSSIAWCCTERTEAPEAYSGASTVLESLDEELTAMVGPEVVVELKRRLS